MTSGGAVHRTRSMLANATAVFGAHAAGWLMTLLVVVVLTNNIDPADVGEYQLAITVWNVGLVFVLAGTDTVVPLRTARDPDQASGMVHAAITGRLITFAAVSVVVAVLVGVSDYSDTERMYIALVAVSTVLAAVGQAVGAAMAGREDFVASSRVNVAVRIGVVAATLLAVGVFDRGIASVILIALVGSVIATVALYGVGGAHGLSFGLAPVSDGWSMIRAGSPYLFGAVALVLYHEMDVFVMRALLDAEALGWYATSDRVFGVLMTIPAVVLAVAMPRMARLQDADRDEASRTFADGFDSLMLIGVPAGVGLFLLGRELADLIFGPEFHEAGPVLAVFGLMLPLTFQMTLIGQCAIVMGRERLLYWLLLGAAILTLPLDLLLVPFADERFDNGAIGGAMSYVVTESVLVLVSITLLVPFVRRRATATRTLKVLLAVGVMVAVVYPLRSVMILVPIGAGIITYGVAILVFRALRPDEIARGRDLVRRLVPAGDG